MLFKNWFAKWFTNWVDLKTQCETVKTTVLDLGNHADYTVGTWQPVIDATVLLIDKEIDYCDGVLTQKTSTELGTIWGELVTAYNTLAAAAITIPAEMPLTVDDVVIVEKPYRAFPMKRMIRVAVGVILLPIILILAVQGYRAWQNLSHADVEMNTPAANGGEIVTEMPKGISEERVREIVTEIVSKASEHDAARRAVDTAAEGHSATGGDKKAVNADPSVKETGYSVRGHMSGVLKELGYTPAE